MRLIDADLFDITLADAQAKCKKCGGNFRYGVLSNVRANLLKQPTVDAVPVKHGKWLIVGGNKPPEYHHHHQCSVCAEYAPMRPPYGSREMLTPWCPKCSAKMDLEEQNASD